MRPPSLSVLGLCLVLFVAACTEQAVTVETEMLFDDSISMIEPLAPSVDFERQTQEFATESNANRPDGMRRFVFEAEGFVNSEHAQRINEAVMAEWAEWDLSTSRTGGSEDRPSDIRAEFEDRRLALLWYDTAESDSYRMLLSVTSERRPIE